MNDGSIEPSEIPSDISESEEECEEEVNEDEDEEDEEEDEEEVDDLELVAVITAAIAASENTPADGLVVRSIRKVNKTNNWKR